MVLVATRRDTGKAQALGLTNSKRWDCQCLSPKFTYPKANIARLGSSRCSTAERVAHKKRQYMKRRSEFPTPPGRESSEHGKGWKQWLSRANHAI
jgi:hypothetical protein